MTKRISGMTGQIRQALTVILLSGATMFSGLAIAVPIKAPPPAAWPKDPSQTQMVRDIVAIVQEKHFRKQPLDDRLSSLLLDNYLKSLDPNRQVFLQADIAEFEQFRHVLDDQLSAGQLDAARAIYQRYHDRFRDRLDWVIASVPAMVRDMEFNGEEFVQIDREDSPWPANLQEADQLWSSYIGNSILSLILSDKPVENIATTLTRRFQNQRERLDKQTAMDHFELYMNAFTELYDPHTNYMSPKSAENFDIGMALSLEGIGAVLEKDDELTKVTRLVPAGPADRQGELKAGDHIMAIAQGQHSEEWEDVVGWRLDEVVELIRGKSNTWVRLQVKRGEDAIRTIAIKREKVKLEDQAASKQVLEVSSHNKQGINYRIGIITIPNFYLDFEAMRKRDPDAKSTTRDVVRILQELENESVDGIIIDLRDNGGGSLLEATQLTDLFIDQGPVVQILNSANQVDRRNRATKSGNYDGPLLVLVNHLSASASEIFAGAIQDYRRGIVVGEQTFGKGTVQTLVPLHQGRLKLTEAKFYRVSGDSTQHRGVVPDILYPALLPYEEVGESALEHALPWDRIQPAPHYTFMDLASYLPALRARHEARMQDNVEYDYLLRQKEWLDQQRNRKQLPLNLQKRENLKQQDDQTLLEITNAVRKSKGLKPLVSVTDLEEENRKKREQKNPSDDFLLVESANILADFIAGQKVQPQRVAERAN